VANPVKERLARQLPVVGVIDPTGSGAVADIMGIAGFDFIMFDMEHGAFGEETLAGLVRRAQAAGTTPLARVWDNHRKLVLRALDTGCLGVMVPQIESGAEALAAAQAFKYYPDGTRSLARSTQAARWGAGGTREYVAGANRDALVILQIETKAGLERTAEIVATPGVDCIFIGPSDLSQDLGHPGDHDHPEVLEAFRAITRASLDAGKAVGTIANSAAEVARWYAEGHRFFLAGTTGIILEAAAGLATAMRRAAG